MSRRWGARERSGPTSTSSALRSRSATSRACSTKPFGMVQPGTILFLDSSNSLQRRFESPTAAIKDEEPRQVLDFVNAGHRIKRRMSCHGHEFLRQR